jgi:threonyl-tRNA synthetase
VVVTREEALSMFEENKFKTEIIDGLPQDATISLYRCGPMVCPFCDCLACLLPVRCTLLPSQEVAQ